MKETITFTREEVKKHEKCVEDLRNQMHELKRTVAHLNGERNVLIGILRSAYYVIKTIEGEDTDESEKLSDLLMTIEYAIAGYDEFGKQHGKGNDYAAR